MCQDSTPSGVTSPPFTVLSTCRGGGYTYARTEPKHPRRNRNGLYPLHRIVVENRIGRLLRNNEQVHHKDGDRFNNESENLVLLTIEEHARLHSVDRQSFVSCVCPICGTTFTLKAHVHRQRITRNSHNLVACSRSCGGKLSVT
jgi:hypothetical protein